MNSKELKKLKDDLWHSADMLRAGAHLAANKYGQPILGLIFLRYADILLMYAEAQTEYLNKAQGASIINDELVYKSIEMVRQRAGLNPYTLKRGMSYDQLIKLIRNERR